MDTNGRADAECKLVDCMRVLVYNSQTGKYFGSAQIWTSDPGTAHDFGGTVQAAEAIHAHGVPNAEIILAFDEPHVSDMHLPVVQTT